MKVIRIQICLDTSAFRALRIMAEKEFRDPRVQAALIIRRNLEAKGYLPSGEVKSEDEIQVNEVNHEPH